MHKAGITKYLRVPEFREANAKRQTKSISLTESFPKAQTTNWAPGCASEQRPPGREGVHVCVHVCAHVCVQRAGRWSISHSVQNMNYGPIRLQLHFYSFNRGRRRRILYLLSHSRLLLDRTESKCHCTNDLDFLKCPNFLLNKSVWATRFLQAASRRCVAVLICLCSTTTDCGARSNERITPPRQMDRINSTRWLQRDGTEHRHVNPDLVNEYSPACTNPCNAILMRSLH